MANSGGKEEKASAGSRSGSLTGSGTTSGPAAGATGAGGPAGAGEGGQSGRSSGGDGKGAAAKSGGPAPLLPSLSLPKGGGAVRGIGEKFQVAAATGTASLSIPIAVSPGRAGAELELSLSYDSGGGNGPFGLGWRLSPPAISRKTDKGLPRYWDGEESDVFLSAGAEDLVPALLKNSDRPDEETLGEYRVKRYRPRVEGGFSRIERFRHLKTGEVHWEVTGRSNVTQIFGSSSASRIADPSNPGPGAATEPGSPTGSGRVFSWLLDEIRDDRGNITRFEYKAEDGVGVADSALPELSRFREASDGSRSFTATAQRYLKRIFYGNATPGVAGGWLFEVVLDYGEHDPSAPQPSELRPWSVRPDPHSTFKAGFEVRTYRLCQRVLMFHRFAELGAAPVLVRGTEFEYLPSPTATYLSQVIHSGYLTTAAGTYEKQSLPPLELEYSAMELQDHLKFLPKESLEGLGGGVDGGYAQWVDLDGEGLSGVLLAEPRGWYYKANRGEGELAPPKALLSLPVPADLGPGAQQLMDLDGDGRLELAAFGGPLPGTFTRTAEGDWGPFQAFASLPNIDWSDPNLKFVDLTGDGFADLLISEHEVLVAYQSRAKLGFEGPTRRSKPRKEKDGPAVVFSDATESVQLADMSGDGLSDIVRIRNGEVCYWPNLGYGRFGAKITLSRSPRFDQPDQFDPRRLRLGDIDGSGTTDLVYFNSRGAKIWFNQSGNGFSDAQEFRSLPPPRLELPDRRPGCAGDGHGMLGVVNGAARLDRAECGLR